MLDHVCLCVCVMCLCIGIQDEDQSASLNFKFFVFNRWILDISHLRCPHIFLVLLVFWGKAEQNMAVFFSPKLTVTF